MNITAEGIGTGLCDEDSFVHFFPLEILRVFKEELIFIVPKFLTWLRRICADSRVPTNEYLIKGKKLLRMLLLAIFITLPGTSKKTVERKGVVTVNGGKSTG